MGEKFIKIPSDEHSHCQYQFADSLHIIIQILVVLQNGGGALLAANSFKIHMCSNFLRVWYSKGVTRKRLLEFQKYVFWL